jgi:hypothetical protein
MRRWPAYRASANPVDVPRMISLIVIPSVLENSAASFGTDRMSGHRTIRVNPTMVSAGMQARPSRPQIQTRPAMSPGPTEAHDQHRCYCEVPHGQPERQAAVARLRQVDADPAEGIRQRDQHDRGVDPRQQGAQRGIASPTYSVARARLAPSLAPIPPGRL